MMYLVTCKKCNIAKRFYRFYKESKKICLQCHIDSIEGREKKKYELILAKQARDGVFKNRDCLSCDIFFETKGPVHKCPLCTELHRQMTHWNER